MSKVTVSEVCCFDSFAILCFYVTGTTKVCNLMLVFRRSVQHWQRPCCTPEVGDGSSAFGELQHGSMRRVDCHEIPRDSFLQ